MIPAFIRLHLFLARHRGSVLLLTLAFLVVAGLLGRRLQVEEDFTGMLPMSDPAIAEQVGALKHIVQADRLYFDLRTVVPDPDRLARAADRLGAELGGIPGITEVRSGLDAADVGAAYQRLQSQLPVLLNSNDLHALESRLTPGALEKRLAWLKKAMSQPQGLMFKEVAQTDPAGLGDVVSARLRLLQAGAGDAQIVDGLITSADGCHALMSASPGFRSSDVRKSAALMEAVFRAVRRVETGFEEGTVRIAITGAHRSALENATLIREDSVRTSALATLAVAVLMWAVYRRRWLALLTLVPMVFGLLGATLVFHLTGDAVFAVALGCGSILIGVTVDYGICVLYHGDDSPPAGPEERARMVAQLAPSLVFGALTTMAAFFVMFLSPVAGHRQLGLFGAVGVGLAAIFALTVLPLAIPTGAGGAARTLPLTRLMERLFDWRARRSRGVLTGLLLFTVLCGAGLGRLRFEGDFARLNGVTPETRRDEEGIREVWGNALSLTTIVVEGATREEALRKNEQVYAALQRWVTPAPTNPATGDSGRFIESVSSLAPLLPSARTQAANRRDWDAFWTESRLADLNHSLVTAGARLGFRAAAFEPFLERIASPVLPPVAETNSALDRLAADFFSGQDGRVYLATLAKVKDREGYRRLHGVVHRAVPDARVLNKAALTDEVARIARRALPVFGGLVMVLNAALLFLLLGRLELVLVTLLPMVAGVFWTLGSLGLLGLPIDVANFIFVIFVVGVGGDYSLFLVLAELDRLRGGADRAASTGGAVTLCALTTLFGVGALALARHPALFSVGVTALLGISLSLLAALFLVPPCIRWLGRVPAPPPCPIAGPGSLRKAIGRLYRLQGPCASQFVFWKMRIDPLFAAVDAATPVCGEILDLGCGFGIVAHWLTLARPDRRVRGVDFDAEKIRVAVASARGNPRAVFEQGDLLEWSAYPDCDAALLCDVLHYFPREAKRRVLRNVFRALRPGGRLILRDACADRTPGHGRVVWAEKWAVRLGLNRTRHGLHFENKEAHLALLREAGFAEIEVREDAGLGSNILLVAGKPS